MATFGGRNERIEKWGLGAWPEGTGSGLRAGSGRPRSDPREATLKEALPYLQNADAIAFVLLGVATAVSWAKRQNRSLGFLALAIVLLALVSLLGRVPAAYTAPLLPEVSLLVFMG